MAGLVLPENSKCGWTESPSDEPADHPGAGADGHSELAHGHAVACRHSARDGRQPLFYRQIALHPEAKAVAAADGLDGDRPRRLGHRARVAAGANLADVPAPLAGRLAVFVN